MINWEDDELKAMDPTLVELHNDNVQRTETLIRDGCMGWPMPDRHQMVTEVILDAVIGTTSEIRMQFERQFETAISQILDNVEKAWTNQKLTAGVSTDPKVLQQMAKNAHIFKPE